MRSLLRQLLPEECRRGLTLQLCSMYAVLSLLCSFNHVLLSQAVSECTTSIS